MNKALAFSDVLIVPQFSSIVSRSEVSCSTTLMGVTLSKGIISSNMDSVTEENMCNAIAKAGGIGCLHRFMPISKNVWMYQQSNNAVASIGVGKDELERFEALLHAGCNKIVLDVAHGASMQVVNQVHEMRKIDNNFNLMVGNFATGRSIKDFLYYLGNDKVDAFKVGVGGGSSCLTRVVTGCGLPTFASIVDCVKATDLPIVADGGIKSGGDYSKCFAAGASAVMLGGLLAGTDESSSQFENTLSSVNKYKRYRGSASAESYAVQGKNAEHRTPEGDSFLVPYVGSVANVVQKLDASLRSSMSYVGASNLSEYKERVEFVEITSAGHVESNSHGRNQ